MNEQNQDPLDKILDPLYQQRKQRLVMPTQMAENIHQLACEQQSVEKKSRLLRPPIWASTLAACFVIVISINLMPLEPQFETGSSYGFDSPAVVANQDEDAQQGADTITESIAQRSKADTQNKVASSQAKSVKGAFAPSVPVETAGYRLSQTPTFEQKHKSEPIEVFNETFQSAADTSVDEVPQKQTKISMQSKAAPAGEMSNAQLTKSYKARTKISEENLNALSQDSLNSTADMAMVKVTGAQIKHLSTKIVQVQALAVKSKLSLRTAIDCSGETVLIDTLYLDGIKADDWVVIHYNAENEINSVEKLQIKPDDCNDN